MDDDKRLSRPTRAEIDRIRQELPKAKTKSERAALKAREQHLVTMLKGLERYEAIQARNRSNYSSRNRDE